MINGIGYLISALTVYIIVSAIKPFVEAWWMPVNGKDGKPNTLHDPAIRLLAFIIGAASNLTIYFVFSGRHDGPGVFTAVIVGIGAALTAIGTYHLETTNYFNLGGSGSSVDPVKQQVQIAVTTDTADTEASLDRVAAKVAAVHAAVDALPVALVPALQPPTPPPVAAVEDAQAQAEAGSAA